MEKRQLAGSRNVRKNGVPSVRPENIQALIDEAIPKLIGIAKIPAERANWFASEATELILAQWNIGTTWKEKSPIFVQESQDACRRITDEELQELRNLRAVAFKLLKAFRATSANAVWWLRGSEILHPEMTEVELLQHYTYVSTMLAEAAWNAERRAQVALEGVPKKRGRPRKGPDTREASSFEIFLDRLAITVREAGGELTFTRGNDTGSLRDFVDELRRILPYSFAPPTRRGRFGGVEFEGRFRDLKKRLAK
jgi:hypothetical protein